MQPPGARKHPRTTELLLLTANRTSTMLLLTVNRIGVAPEKLDILYGALELMVLRTLDSLGPLHGYGIARRIEQISEGSLALNQGTLYPALIRLEQKGLIGGKWGPSENNRRAKFYALTARGRKHLVAETERWEQMAHLLARFLKPGEV